MAILRIRLLGDPILRRKCKAVPRVTSAERKLIDDMLETMEHANGAGLAAPQVGVDQRIVLVRLGESRKTPGEVVPIINPAIVRRNKEMELETEGCLSIPTVQAEVERATKVTVRGLNAKGKKTEITQHGFGARVIQHEIDHLDGVLFIDKFVPDTLDFVRTKKNEEGEDEIVLLPTTVDEVHAFFKEGARRVSRKPLDASSSHEQNGR